MLSTFEAIALPARRAILEALRDSPRSVGELAEMNGLSQPMTSKHLKALREAGFVTVRVDAQRRWYELRADPFVELAQWIEPYRAMWEARLGLLGDRLNEMRDEEQHDG